MKRLYLLRHAKTETYAADGGDHERALTERGHADAALIGQTIARLGYRPDIILCSTAKRATETMDIVLSCYETTPQVKLEAGLYLAPAATILQRAGAVGGEMHSVLFIGHNPGLEDLAIQLAGQSDLGVRAAEKFPTACFAAFESPAPTWVSAVRGSWAALDILRPSELRQTSAP